MIPSSPISQAVQAAKPREPKCNTRTVVVTIVSLLFLTWAFSEAFAAAPWRASVAVSRWQPHRNTTQQATISSVQIEKSQQQHEQQQQQRLQDLKQQHEQHLQVLQHLQQQQEQIKDGVQKLRDLEQQLQQQQQLEQRVQEPKQQHEQQLQVLQQLQQQQEQDQDGVQQLADTGQHTPQAEQAMAATKPATGANAVPPRQSVSPVACTSQEMSKRSCVFQDVCLQSAADKKGLSAVLQGNVQPAHADMLKQHLVNIFEGIVNAANITVSIAPAGSSAVPARALQPPTIIWRPAGANQYSFGHALINEAFPAFLVLQNHYQQIPENLQLLAVGGWHPVLHNVLAGTITGHAAEFDAAVAASPAAACFSQLLVGDGGYIAASRGSLAGTGTSFGREPSFFSSANWHKFRQHALQMHGIQQEQPPKPLIVLNDKRFGASNQTDRRMLLDIEQLVSNLSALYPQADVRAVRFRDLNMTEQIRQVAHATVFITTQGSSAFRLVFLPEGATCVYVGSPRSADATKWVPFYELDRWFPLSYLQFQRYEVALNSTAEYEASPMPGHWAPGDPAEAREWWLYNAHVRLQLDRLKVMLDRALQVL